MAILPFNRHVHAKAAAPRAHANANTHDSMRLPKTRTAQSSSMIDLAEASKISVQVAEDASRSESQIWRPREALSRNRPSWASVGHLARVPWGSESRFDGTSSIRMVSSSNGSGYDVDRDSMWRPLDSDTEPLLRKESSGQEAQRARLETKRHAIDAVILDDKTRQPSGMGIRRDSARSRLGQNGKMALATDCKESRFIEHLSENEDKLRRVGAWEEKEKRRWSIFSNLTRLRHG